MSKHAQIAKYLMVVVGGILGFYRETGYVERFVLFVELSHVFMETEKSQDLQLASWRPRVVLGIAPVHDPRPENQEC